ATASSKTTSFFMQIPPNWAGLYPAKRRDGLTKPVAALWVLTVTPDGQWCETSTRAKLRSGTVFRILDALRQLSEPRAQRRASCRYPDTLYPYGHENPDTASFHFRAFDNWHGPGADPFSAIHHRSGFESRFPLRTGGGADYGPDRVD